MAKQKVQESTIQCTTGVTFTLHRSMSQNHVIMHITLLTPRSPVSVLLSRLDAMELSAELAQMAEELL